MTLALIAPFAIVLVVMSISVSVLLDKGIWARAFDAYRSPAYRRSTATVMVGLCVVVLIGLSLIAVGVLPSSR